MKEQDLKKFQPGGLGTYEAATAHHKYNKESTALREIYKHIYSTNKKSKNGLMASRDSVGSFPSEMFSEMSLNENSAVG